MNLLKRGYLPEEDPLNKLPKDKFSVEHRIWWDDLVSDLPKLLRRPSYRNKVIETMPALQLPENLNQRELESAMRNLSFLAAGFVWEGGSHSEYLPPQIAIPLYEVAKKLGRPPILAYNSYALNNWARIDPNGPIEVENLSILKNFNLGMPQIDEDWFILIHIQIEQEAGPAMEICRALQFPTFKQVVHKHFETIFASMEKVNKVMFRMPEKCDPKRYFQYVRPWITGYMQYPVIFLGVTDPAYKTPARLIGETGAQSMMMPTLDAAFGIDHSPNDLKHFTDKCLHEYAPKEHREYVLDLLSGQKITQLVLDNYGTESEEAKLHDACIGEMIRFRERHLQYAHDYIANQTETNSLNSNRYGTGGSMLIQYLQGRLERTKRQLIYKAA